MGLLSKTKEKLTRSIDKFSFAQMTSNSDGKTSGSGTMGVLICSIGALCFLMGCVDKMFIGKDVEILDQTIIFTLIGAGLLGYRKSVKTPKISIDDPTPSNETKPRPTK